MICAWRRNRKSWRLLILAAMVLPCSGGCVWVVAGLAGAGGAAYVMGDAERLYPYPIDTVWAASLDALAETGVAVTYHGRDQLTGRIEARTATNQRIKIHLTALGDSTEVKIRVNTFGDEQITSAIVGRIDSRLPQGYVALSGEPAM